MEKVLRLVISNQRKGDSVSISSLSLVLHFPLPAHSTGDAMVLGKLPYNLDYSRAGPTALAVGVGCLDIFTLIYPLFGRRPDTD